MTSSSNFPSIIKDIFKFLGINLGLSVLIGFILSPLLIILGINALDYSNTSLFIAGFLNILIAIITLKIYKTKIEYKKFETKDLTYLFGSLLAMFIVSFVIGILLKNEQDIKNNVLAFPIGGFFLAVIGAPIAEELLYRKIMYEIFSKYSNKIFMIISAIIFGLIHIQSFDKGFFNGIAPIIPTTVMGLIFAFTYIKRQNILLNILIHAAFNGIVLILSIILI